MNVIIWSYCACHLSSCVMIVLMLWVMKINPINSKCANRVCDNYRAQECDHTIALFCDEEVVVLLAALCEDVFAVEQVGCADGGVLVGEFFLVDAHAAALCHLFHFAL